MVLDIREAEDLKEVVAMLPRVVVAIMVVAAVIMAVVVETMEVGVVTMVADEVLMVVVDEVAVGCPNNSMGGLRGEDLLNNNSSTVDLRNIKEGVEDLLNSQVAVGTVVEEVDIAVVLVLVLAMMLFHPMEAHQGNPHTPSCTKQPLYLLLPTKSLCCLQLHPIPRLVLLSHQK